MQKQRTVLELVDGLLLRGELLRLLLELRVRLVAREELLLRLVLGLGHLQLRAQRLQLPPNDTLFDFFMAISRYLMHFLYRSSAGAALTSLNNSVCRAQSK